MRSKQRPEYNQKINSTIQRIGIYGEGVGHWHGYTMFIDGALPGEVVQARVKEVKKSYGRGELIAIENPSPFRVKPQCPLFAKCGGCQTMHLSYDSQLEMKRQRVADAFERIGKFENIEVAPCLPSPSPFAYRNKIQVPIRGGDQGLEIGFYARNSHSLVEVDFCHIHCPLGQKVYESAVAALKRSGLAAFDWNTGKGELRHLIIKTAVNTGQALVILVTNGECSLDQVAVEIMKSCPEVKGVVQNINIDPDNVVLGEEYKVVRGSGTIEETICGLTFNVSPASFFQVNPAQAERLYEQVAEYCELEGTETVLDAYCGVGTFSLVLSRRAKKVVGIECVPQAIDDARENASKNQIENATFICGDVEEKIKETKEVDVVVLNPPRKGCEGSFLESAAALSPKRIVYVSCDPATLARDLARLAQLGYTITAVQPFDMFPQTAHVETVVQLKQLPGLRKI